jgi:NodT family efflux transporter outer membrane factor (OMF) lipoprotein
VAVPPSFSESGDAPTPERWWDEFNDPALSALVDKALNRNLDLHQALGRLEQAVALARQAGAPLWPEATGSADASRSRSEVEGLTDTETARVKQFSLELAAAYELDLWGRVQSQKRAADLDASASREDLETAAVTLAATVGELWYSLAEQRAQRALLEEQIKASETLLELVELRFARGLASALDVYQQRQQLSTTRGQRPAIESQIQLIRHQLAVLVGEPPGATLVQEPSELPALPPLPQTGLPADLLQRRPDVRAASSRLAAADHRVAAAVAERLPAVRLSAAAGLRSAQAGALAEGPAWSLAAGALAPVFNAGRLRAEVTRTEAQAGELLAAYGLRILTAFREVEDALAQESGQEEFVESVEQQVELGTATLREARLRYANGLSDYLPVLAALQALQQAERELIAARGRLIAYRIQLYRALGGSWPAELTAAETKPAANASGGAR